MRHPRMNIVEDDVELPDGKVIKYIREAPVNLDSVTTIAINDKGEILIQREYSYPPDEVMYQLPGGKIEPGEDVVVAANRELSEESGFAATDCTVLGWYYVNNRRSNAKQYVVICKKIETKNTQKDAEEFIESQWLAYPAVKQLIHDGKVINMNMLAALQLFDTFTQ